MVSAGLTRRAGNLITDKIYPNGGAKPVAGWLYSRWFRGREDVLAGFAHGALIRPKVTQYLPIPLDTVDTSVMASLIPGGRAALRRMTPRLFEQQTGLKLRFVYRGSRPPLLVADQARLTKGGKARLSGKRRGTRSATLAASRLTVPVFVLVSETKVPKRFDYEAVERYGDGRLAENFIIELERRGNL